MQLHLQTATYIVDLFRLVKSFVCSNMINAAQTQLVGETQE
jgi:hypothetical protein